MELTKQYKIRTDDSHATTVKYEKYEKILTIIIQVVVRFACFIELTNTIRKHYFPLI